MIRIGKYEHFKGKQYEVIGIAKHSETCEEVVVYRQCYGDFEIWVRPLSMWNDTIENSGITVSRFRFISE